MFAWRDQYLSYNGPSGAATDPYWTYVSLLENFESPQTVFDDASANNFPITVNGDTKPSLQTPFNGNSLYFPAALGNRASVPYNSVFNLGTQDFTAECFVYLNSLAADTSGVIVINAVGGTSSYASVRVGVATTGALYFLCASGVATWINTSTTATGLITTNRWFHIAATRSGSTFRLFINGNQVLTYTSASSLYNGSGLTFTGNFPSGTGFVGTTNGNTSNYRVIVGTALYTANFTPPTTELTAISGTQLLIKNSFTDSSTNGFTVTQGGASVVSQTGPFYVAGGSMYFDGTGDYISAPDSLDFYLTGDFTVEAWAYVTTTGTVRCVIGQWPGVSATNCAWSMDIHSTNNLYFGYGIGGTNAYATSTLSVVANQWNHLAVTRSGTSLRIFVNGISSSVVTVSGALNNSNAPLNIGRKGDNSNYVTGWISNARVIKGTALYTGNFTVPSSPLTAVAGTSILVNATNQGLLNNSTFIDSTTTRPAALTVSGSPRYSGLSPFGNSYPGSVNFPSSGTLTSTSSVLQTGNFTVEMYVNCAIPASFNGFFNLGSETTGRQSYGVLTSGGNMLAFYNPFGGSNQTFGIVPPNQWNHIAFVRSGTTVTCYVNGTQSGTTKTLSGNAGNTGGCVVGHPTNMNGYITNVRVTSSALYLSSFTPSTTPLPMVPGTVFLLQCNGAFQDLSNSGQLITNTATNSVITTQFAKFGTQSMSVSGGNYSTAINSTSLQLTGDFTIEGWVYHTTSSAGTYTVMSKGSSTTGWMLQLNSNNWLTWTSGTTVLKTGTQLNLIYGSWYYFAITRTGSTCYMFLNGTQLGTTFTDATSYTQTENLNIGANRSGANGWLGYMDDLRITNGVCRYTGTFSPPSTSFPTS